MRCHVGTVCAGGPPGCVAVVWCMRHAGSMLCICVHVSTCLYQPLRSSRVWRCGALPSGGLHLRSAHCAGSWISTERIFQAMPWQVDVKAVHVALKRVTRKEGALTSIQQLSQADSLLAASQRKHSSPSTYGGKLRRSTRAVRPCIAISFRRSREGCGRTHRGPQVLSDYPD
jgi:hypothetical protein